MHIFESCVVPADVLVDEAHHENYAKRALEQVLAFDAAVSAANDLTDDMDTLIVVTADFASGINIQGNLPRGVDLLCEPHFSCF